MLALVSKAEPMFEEANELWEAFDYDSHLEYWDLVSQAEDLHQDFLSGIRRYQIDSSSGKPPPTSPTKNKIDANIQELKKNRDAAREAVRRHHRMYKRSKVFWRVRLPRADVSMFGFSLLKSQ